MKPRQILALFLIFLLTTSTFAREIPDRLRSQRQLKDQRVKRQSDVAINTIMQMALKYAPILINSIVGGGGGGGGGLADLAAAFLGGGGVAGAAAKPAVNTKVTAVTPDKADKVGSTPATSDIFSWSNLLTMGVKIALSLISSYTSGGIDRNGQEVSPMQTVLGTVISALIGSEDPQEVATMAKQATEVFGLLGTLVNALRTSFLS